MTQEPTQREMELARKIAELEAAAARSKLSGGGLFVQVVNSVLAVVPKWIITWGVVAFLAFHAWDGFNKVQQLSAQTQTLEAQAATKAAEYAAQSAKAGDTSVMAAQLRTEIDAAQAAADRARADAQAQGTVVDGVSARLGTLQAETKKAEAEAAKAAATIEAYEQRTAAGVPVVIARKLADVEKAEAKANEEWNTLRQQIATTKYLLEEQQRPKTGFEKMFDNLVEPRRR